MFLRSRTPSSSLLQMLPPFLHMFWVVFPQLRDMAAFKDRLDPLFPSPPLLETHQLSDRKVGRFRDNEGY